MFKVGDKVKAKNKDITEDYGEFGTVMVVDEGDTDMPYKVKFDKDTDEDNGMWVFVNEVEPVEESEVITCES